MMECQPWNVVGPDRVLSFERLPVDNHVQRLVMDQRPHFVDWSEGGALFATAAVSPSPQRAVRQRLEKNLLEASVVGQHRFRDGQVGWPVLRTTIFHHIL